MKEDKRITEKDIDEAEVHLKPIFGITPGRYLAVIYALGIVATLFLLVRGLPSKRTTWNTIRQVIHSMQAAMFK